MPASIRSRATSSPNDRSILSTSLRIDRSNRSFVIQGSHHRGLIRGLSADHQAEIGVTEMEVMRRIGIVEVRYPRIRRGESAGFDNRAIMDVHPSRRRVALPTSRSVLLALEGACVMPAALQVVSSLVVPVLIGVAVGLAVLGAV